MHSLQTIHKQNQAILPITTPSVNHTDFLIRDEGSIYLLYSLSPDADSWINQNITEEAQWFGSGLVIGHRYIESILDGIAAGGLEVLR